MDKRPGDVDLPTEWRRCPLCDVLHNRTSGWLCIGCRQRADEILDLIGKEVNAYEDSLAD